MTPEPSSTSPVTKLSLVVPLYNNASAIAPVLRDLNSGCHPYDLEVILVNDGSSDATGTLCAQLAAEFPNVIAIQLSRTFGNDNALLAGLRHATGDYAAVINALGQPGIWNVTRMLDELRAHNCDAVYGLPIASDTSRFHQFRTRLNNYLATTLLQKPANVSLSNFKVMNRFVIDEVLKYQGPFPFLDGLIHRSTCRVRQVTLDQVENPVRTYSRKQQFSLWLNMFLNFSITPLRLSAYLGVAAAAFSVIALGLIWIDKIYFTKDLTPGIRTTLALISLFAGMQLLILGLVGEYLGRLFLDRTGAPQSVVRYVQRGQAKETVAVNRES